LKGNNIKKIPATRESPRITFDSERGIFKIEGRYIIKGPDDILEPVYEWFENYFLDPPKLIRIDICLLYIRTGCVKYLLNLLKYLDDFFSASTEFEAEINWHYEEEDEDTLEKGQDIGSLLSSKFNYIEIPE